MWSLLLHRGGFYWVKFPQINCQMVEIREQSRLAYAEVDKDLPQVFLRGCRDAVARKEV